MTFNMDDDLHHKFKLFCAKNKTSMSNTIIISIKILLKNQKKKIK